MNREVHVRFREELGVKIPLLTRLGDVKVSSITKKRLIDYLQLLLTLSQSLQRNPQ